MTLYALDDIDDALDATRAFLWPFDLRRWAKLALVVFFLGGVGSGFNPFQFSFDAPPEGVNVPAGLPSPVPALDASVSALIIALGAVVVLLGLLFLLVGSIMEFVFVESLRRDAVAIRRYWSDRWRQGTRLFGFRVVLGVLTLGLVVALGIVVLAPVLFGGGELSFGLFLVVLPAFFVVAVLSGLAYGFTTVFVVPVMIVEETSVLSGWRRFWGTLVGEWKQYLVYAVMGFVLQIAGGLIAGVATAIAAVVLLFPFGFVGVLGFVLLMVSEIAGFVVIGGVVALYALSVLVAFLFVSVPVQAFLRYYALFVLGDTNGSFDLIQDRRASVRT